MVPSSDEMKNQAAVGASTGEKKKIRKRARPYSDSYLMEYKLRKYTKENDELRSQLFTLDGKQRVLKDFLGFTKDKLTSALSVVKDLEKMLER